MKLLIGFALLWAAFAWLPRWWPESWKPDWMEDATLEISVDQEEQLGQFIVDAFLEETLPIDTPVVDSAMWVIESRLLQHVGTTDYEFTFHLVEDDLVNAMTMPGGNIVVFSGLLEFCESPEEVAAVLAHEIGHVQHRHTVEKLVAELGMAFVVGVLTGGDATLIHELSQTLISGAFSRSQESEADEYAMQLMLDADINPRSIATFFRRLNRENMGYSEYMEWMMSHPHNNARIKASLEFPVPEGFKSEPIDIDWDRVVAAL